MNGKSTRQERTRAYTGDLLNGRDQSNIDKVGSRKLAVTAVAGAAAVTGTVELIWPMAVQQVSTFSQCTPLLKKLHSLDLALFDCTFQRSGTLSVGDV